MPLIQIITQAQKHFLLISIVSFRISRTNQNWSNLVICGLFVVFLISTTSVVYVLALVLLIKRKDFQPLKSRSVSLIFVSTLGNFLYFSAMMYNKILQNNRWEIWKDLKSEVTFNTTTRAAIELSCFFSNSSWWLFRTVWFVPYLFRCYRLHLIWGMQKIYYKDDEENALEDSNSD